MTKRSRAKTILFHAVLWCAVLGLIELMAWTAYRMAFAESFSYRKLQAARLTLLQPRQQGPTAGEQLSVPVIHPYYGFVSSPAIGWPVNKLGFLGREDHIQSAGPDKVVVALIGGSMAAQLASDAYAGDVLESELKKVPGFQNKNLVILNLGNGAFKQPQGLIAINDILSRGGHIDVVIALDGLNEIALPEAAGNVGNAISPFYPQNWLQLVDSKVSRAQIRALARSDLASDARVRLAAIFAKPILRHTVTANLIWRAADLRLDNIAAAYRKSADEEAPADPTSRLSRDRRAFLGPVAEYATRRDLYIDIARNWGRSAVLLNNTMAAQGGHYFHFLQPNQYVAGSKPLGAHEQTIALHSSSPYRKGVEIGYPYLQAVGESLRSAGVRFDDLTRVFAGMTQELYNDNCCHVNKEGNAILARAIAAALTTHMSSPAGGRSRPLAIDQVNFGSSLFEAPGLRRLAARSPDYNDGSRDRIRSAGTSAPAPSPQVQAAAWRAMGTGTYHVQGDAVVINGHNQLFTLAECPTGKCEVLFSVAIHRADAAHIGVNFLDDRGMAVSGSRQPISGIKGESRVQALAPASARTVRAYVVSDTGIVEFSNARLQVNGHPRVADER